MSDADVDDGRRADSLACVANRPPPGSAPGDRIGIALRCCACWLRRSIAIFGTPADRPSLAAASAAESGGEPLETFAGIPPVAYLVQRIGGPYVRVEVLVQAGQDPHIFEPTPRQVIALSQARLFFRVGMPFEDRLIEHIAGGPAHFTVVDTAAGIARGRRATSAKRDAHGDGDGHDHDDEGQADPHVWLSPPLLKTMAANVAAALCQADPRHAAGLSGEPRRRSTPNSTPWIAASHKAWRLTAGRRFMSSTRPLDTLPTPTACGRSRSRSKASRPRRGKSSASSPRPATTT